MRSLERREERALPRPQRVRRAVGRIYREHVQQPLERLAERDGGCYRLLRLRTRPLRDLELIIGWTAEVPEHQAAYLREFVAMARELRAEVRRGLGRARVPDAA